jgi:hypothetical protein
MRFVILSTVLIAAFTSTEGRAAPNVPLCVAIENNYNQCLKNEQAKARWRHEEEEEQEDYGIPPWERRHRRSLQPSDCNAWLLQLKANGCF